MVHKTHKGSSGVIAGAIIVGAVIIGMFIYIGLQNFNKGTQNLQTNDKNVLSTQSTKQATVSNDTLDKSVTNTRTLQKNTAQETKEVTSNQEEVSNELSNTDNIDDESLIKEALLQKSNIPENKLQFSIGENTGQIARGTVKNKDDMGGAMWFAAKDSQNQWTITFIGQGVPDCTQVNPYHYPLSWSDYCMDSHGNTVHR